MTINELFQLERKAATEEIVWESYSKNYFDEEQGIDGKKGESL